MHPLLKKTNIVYRDKLLESCYISLGILAAHGACADKCGEMTDEIKAIESSAQEFWCVEKGSNHKPWMEQEPDLTDFFRALSKVESNHNDDAIWHAICQVESGGNPDAHNLGEDARGIAQIRAIMVEDVNRIVGSDKYSHDDAWCAEKSREMFDIYNGHYHPKGDAERISRCWNGGPRGHKKPATEKYWEKVLDAMKASD